MTTTAVPHRAANLEMLELNNIRSKKNVRQHTGNGQGFEDLVQSVREHGILEPIIVRPLMGKDGTSFEIVAGHRRFAAAKKVGYMEIPAVVRELSDQEALEIQVIENLQRADLHPLEEAEGYRQLVAVAKYDVARIAERIGRSAKYVYDRMKLLSLTKENQQLFLEGKITAGHAILLARLKPADQERAADPESEGLFQPERTLWDPRKDEDSDEDLEPAVNLKPRSVRELQGWIDRHVRFDLDSPDLPHLFPETAQLVESAKEEALKVVSITQEHRVQPEAKDGSRIFGPQSWKEVGEELCDHQVMGVIAAGPGRGEAFPVCIDKKKCAVHWGAEQRESKKRAKASAKDGSTGKDRWEKEEERRKAERAAEEEKRKQWAKAQPEILEALAEKVKQAPTKANGLLADIIVKHLHPWQTPKAAAQLVPRGKTADDVLRHVAMQILGAQAVSYRAFHEFPKQAKAFGLDVKKILDGYAPASAQMSAETPTKTKKASPARGKRTKAKKARVSKK